MPSAICLQDEGRTQHNGYIVQHIIAAYSAFCVKITRLTTIHMLQYVLMRDNGPLFVVVLNCTVKASCASLPVVQVRHVVQLRRQ
jgi:hypothetical protein